MNTAVIYLILMNLIGFALMGVDKQRARRRDWRIPEKSCLVLHCWAAV